MVVRPAAVSDDRQSAAIPVVVGIDEAGQIKEVENLEGVDVARMGAEVHLVLRWSIERRSRTTSGGALQQRERRRQQELLEGEDGSQGMGTGLVDFIEDRQLVHIVGSFDRGPQRPPS